jgi:hypothetical protein
MPKKAHHKKKRVYRSKSKNTSSKKNINKNKNIITIGGGGSGGGTTAIPYPVYQQQPQQIQYLPYPPNYPPSFNPTQAPPIFENNRNIPKFLEDNPIKLPVKKKEEVVAPIKVNLNEVKELKDMMRNDVNAILPKGRFTPDELTKQRNELKELLPKEQLTDLKTYLNPNKRGDALNATRNFLSNRENNINFNKELKTMQDEYKAIRIKPKEEKTPLQKKYKLQVIKELPPVIEEGFLSLKNPEALKTLQKNIPKPVLTRQRSLSEGNTTIETDLSSVFY